MWTAMCSLLTLGYSGVCAYSVPSTSSTSSEGAKKYKKKKKKKKKKLPDLFINCFEKNQIRYARYARRFVILELGCAYGCGCET